MSKSRISNGTPVRAEKSTTIFRNESPDLPSNRYSRQKSLEKSLGSTKRLSRLDSILNNPRSDLKTMVSDKLKQRREES